MSLVPLRNLAAIGVVTDKLGHETPYNAWTAADNVTFRNGYAQNLKGHYQVFGAPACRPQWIFPYADPATGSYFWIYAGLNDAGTGAIGHYNGSVHTDVTRLSSAITVGGIAWTGGALQGLVYINSGFDIPQMLDVAGGAANTVDLVNWPSGYKARVIRPFREFMVALDVTVGVTRNPYRVMWSHPAEPFAVPSSWTPAANNLAGSVYLAEGADYCIDCLPLRGANIIYKQNSTWVMRYTGGNQVFTFERLFGDHGILAPRCVKEFGQGFHFVATVGDIRVHDGVSSRSIANDRVKETIFREIDKTNYHLSYVFSHRKADEIWFCYPTDGFTYANRAAIWNVASGAWSFRDLPGAAHIAYGVIDTGDDSWGADTQAWGDDTTAWGELGYNPAEHNVMIAMPSATTAASKLFYGDTSNQFDGTAIASKIEKTGLDIAGVANDGLISDPSVEKEIVAVWPKLTGGPVNITVGSADTADGAYTWETPQSFSPQTDYKLDFRTNGRYLGLRLESSGVNWELSELILDIVPNGER